MGNVAMIDSLVSVIIPCFNASEFLPRAVNSVLKQKYIHEIIIIDDCSDDNSYSVAESFCEKSSIVSLFRTLKNSGPAAARNLGSVFASGYYLAFLDADDEYKDDFLTVTVECLKSATNGMKAVKTKIDFVDMVGNNLFHAQDPRLEALNFSASSNILIEAESFRKIGGFPDDNVFLEKFGGEDVAFNKAVAKYLEPLGKIDKVGYRCWNRQGSHLDNFIKNTVVDNNGFHFISISPEQAPGGILDQAIERYMLNVGEKFKLKY